MMTEEKNYDKSAIEALLESYETALNAGDANGILDLYDSNPVVMPPNSKAIIGRDAVRNMTDRTLKSIKLSEHFTILEVESNGDIAWVRSSSSARARNLASGNEIEAGANEIFILRRENGDWKIHRYIFTVDSPAAIPS
jgi:uncharacterized protein (TIGR02246 family)